MKKYLLSIIAAALLMHVCEFAKAQSCPGYNAQEPASCTNYQSSGCIITTNQSLNITQCEGTTLTLTASSKSGDVTWHNWTSNVGTTGVCQGWVTYYSGTCSYESKMDITVAGGTHSYYVQPSCGGPKLTFVVTGINRGLAYSWSPASVDRVYCSNQKVSLSPSSSVQEDFHNVKWFKNGVETTWGAGSIPDIGKTSATWTLQGTNSCGIVKTYEQSFTFNPGPANVFISGWGDGVHMCYDRGDLDLVPHGDNITPGTWNWYVSDNDPSNNATIDPSGKLHLGKVVGTITVRLRGYGCGGQYVESADLHIPIDPPLTCPITWTNSGSGCSATTFAMSAQSNSNSVTAHNWYTAATGGANVASTGERKNGVWVSSISPQTFFQTTTYWVAAVCGPCNDEGPRTPVTYTIIDPAPISTSFDPSGAIPTDICVESGVYIQAGGSPTNEYEWRVDDQYKVTPDFTGNRIGISYSGNFFLKGKNECGAWVAASAYPVTIHTKPAIRNFGVSNETAPFCQGTALTSEVNASGENVDWYDWSVTSIGKSPADIYTDLNLASNDDLKINWNPDFSGRATIKVTPHGCANSSVTPITTYIDIHPKPIAEIQGPDKVYVNSGTENVQLNATPGDYKYFWYAQGANYGDTTASVMVSSSSTLQVTTTTEYGCENTSPYTRVFFENVYNVIIETILQTDKKADQTMIQEQDVAGLGPDRRRQTLQYFNGIGDPMQTVYRQNTPDTTDFIQPIVYDWNRREDKKLLPYSNDLNNGWYDRNFSSNQRDYYNDNEENGIPKDGTAYSQTIFDNSPLSRVTRQIREGDKFKYTHYTSVGYLTNGATDVLQFKLDKNGNVYLSPGDAAYFPKRTLYGTKVNDEENNMVIEYKDMQDRLICSKRKISETIYAETYYIYDSFGNLSAVIQPEGVKQILNSIPH